MYGADCLLICKCENKGKCNRFSGCQCPIGWRGQYCEKSGKSSRLLFHLLQNLKSRVCYSWRRLSNLIPLSDSAPEIVDTDSYLEGNLNSSYKIKCSAKGHPLPSHMSIELRKLESTVLKVKESYV